MRHIESLELNFEELKTVREVIQVIGLMRRVFGEERVPLVALGGVEQISLVGSHLREEAMRASLVLGNRNDLVFVEGVIAHYQGKLDSLETPDRAGLGLAKRSSARNATERYLGSLLAQS
jgi:hypothetical protein